MWWIKIWEDILDRGVPAPHQDLRPGFLCQEDNYPQLQAVKNQWGLSSWKKLIKPNTASLKEPTHGLTEVPDIKASRGHCPFSKPSPHRTGKLVSYLRLPSTLLTLFDPPWRFPETLPHPTYRPTQAASPYD